MACSKLRLLSRRETTIWAYALRFKLHLIINDRGELLAFKLTTCGQALCGNVDDRKPVPEMSEGIFGKLFGTRGYISQDLFEQLYEQQLKLITRYKKNMKQRCSALGGFPDLKRLHQEEIG